jgi:hypothetical protein
MIVDPNHLLNFILRRNVDLNVSAQGDDITVTLRFERPAGQNRLGRRLIARPRGPVDRPGRKGYNLRQKLNDWSPETYEGLHVSCN